MVWASRVIAVLLTVGMTIPGWAMRDCCCVRKTSAVAQSCCAKRAAPSTTLKKCCAARAKVAATETVSVTSNHTCLCLLKSSSNQTTNSSRRVAIPSDSQPVVWNTPTDALMMTTPDAQNEVVADLPPPTSGSRLILLCRWLT